MLLANLSSQVFLMFSAVPEPVMILLAGATLIGATAAARQFFKKFDDKSKNAHPVDSTEQ